MFCSFSTFAPTSLPPPVSSSLPAVGSDLKDIQNNKNRYLVASENQRPGNFSTAPIGSLTASPSSGSLCSQPGLQSVTSIQERIMSTPGGEEAIERLKVSSAHPWGKKNLNCFCSLALLPFISQSSVEDERRSFFLPPAPAK